MAAFACVIVLSACLDAEVCEFNQRLDYLRLILNAPDVPADELMAAGVRRAAGCYPPDARERFLKEAGRELARLLSRDLPRLEYLLRRIRPGIS